MADSFVERPPTAAPVPVLVSIPHTGTEVPRDIRARMTPQALHLADTDWHLHRLYDWLPQLGIHTIHARYSRYVVDLNRPADGHALYPGRSETTVVPTTSFAGEALYRSETDKPDPSEIAKRIEAYWRPYHDRLRALLDELLAAHGRVLLFDAHSIRGVVPRFFEGRLTDLVLGDAEGAACRPEIRSAAAEVLAASSYAVAVNKPFKGGFITRSHGRPSQGISALQLEMCQDLYMVEAPPFDWVEGKARRLQQVLHSLMGRLVEVV